MNVEIKTLFKGIFLVTLALVAFTESTSADLFVSQTAGNNLFSATTLDFSQRDTTNNNFVSSLFNISGLISGGFKVEGVRVKKDGREDFKYRIVTVKTAGDDLLCQALQLTVMQNWQIKYQGDLLSFTIDSLIKEKTFDDWIFYLSLSHNEIDLTNKACDFNFVFKTYRDDPDKKTGFWDEEILINNVNSGVWTLPQ